MRKRGASATIDRAARIPPVPNLLRSFGGQVTILSDAAHPSSVVFPIVR